MAPISDATACFAEKFEFKDRGIGVQEHGALGGIQYVSERNCFEEDWQQAYRGSNYTRLLSVKRKFDPIGMFLVHNGVGSEERSQDVCRKARN